MQLQNTEQPQPDFTSLDYYRILNVDKDASIEAIRRAFKTLASKYHPDKPDLGDADKFNLIREAFDVLTDPVRRKHFDDHGRWDPADLEVAKAGIYSIINMIISGNHDLEAVDVIGTVENHLMKTIRETEEANTKAAKSLVRLENGRGRTTDRLILDVFDANIDRIEVAIKSNNDDIRTMGIALTLIQDCSYNFDVPEPKQTTWVTPGHNVAF